METDSILNLNTLNMDTEKSDAEQKKRNVDLDTILVEEIGQFGKFQLKTYFLAMVLGIFNAWGINEYVFTTARINTRCVIPECDSLQPEWSPHWMPNAIPFFSQSSFDNCQRFGNTSALTLANDTCPSTLFDRNILLPCDEYVYENTYTVSYEFGLACDEWSRTLIGTILTVGTGLGLPIAGMISDRWGRRTALCVTAFNTAWLGVVRYWTNTYVGFVVSEFAEALLGAAFFTSAYILLMELVGPKYRVAVSASMLAFNSMGNVLLGLIAWAVPYWRHLTLVLYIPQFIVLSYYWLIPESIRWYMSKGRFEESEALLKKAAKTNGRTVSAKSLAELRQNAEASLKKASETDDREWLVVTVFKHKRVLLRCLVAPVWWVTSTFIFYGLAVNAVNLSGNRYLNYVAVAAVDIPGHIMSVFLLGFIGRKPVLIIAFWMCAACQLAYVFLPEDLFGLSLAVYLIAKFSISMEIVALYVYTAELYPTVKRQTLYNFTSSIGRIGAIVAPLTPAIGAQWFEELPFVLFASLALLSGALVFITPETLGAKLPDTFQEADSLTRKDETDK